MQYRLEDSLGYLAAHIHRKMTVWLMRNFAEAGIPIRAEHWPVLIQLWHEDGLPHVDLVARVARNKPTVTRAIDGLEGQGLVKRIPDTGDRRIKRIWLTQAGRDIMPGIITVALDTLSKAQTGVCEKDMAVCMDVLRKVLGNLSAKI